MSAFTPGPWTISNGVEPGQVDILGAGRVLVADLSRANWARKWEGTVTEANACLISAAPDLLAALKTTRAHLALFCTREDDIAAAIFDLADAAIARVEPKGAS